MLTAVLIALASATCFSFGSALQQRAAERRASQLGLGSLAPALFRRPSWVAGLLLSAVAFALHALALHRGSLSVVQPVIVSGIVIAVFVRAGLERRWPSRQQATWCVVTAAGLVLFLLSLPQAPDEPPEPQYALLGVVAGVGAAGLAVAVSARPAMGRRRRGVLLAAAAGVLFGLVAGLLKLVLRQLVSGIPTALSHWSLWGLVAVGISAILLNQRAYATVSLSTSAPVLNIAQVITALAFGLVVFGERPAETPLTVLGEVAGLLVMLVGIRQLMAAEPERRGDSLPSEPEPGRAR